MAVSVTEEGGGRGTTLRKKLNAAQIRELLKIYAQ